MLALGLAGLVALLAHRLLPRQLALCRPSPEDVSDPAMSPGVRPAFTV
jgi:hypothetical protein